MPNPIRVRAALEAYRAKLLDLTARNRLIHTQRSTSRSGRLEIVDESSDEVFRILARKLEPGDVSVDFGNGKAADRSDGRGRVPHGRE
jgi:hypothetical protein